MVIPSDHGHYQGGCTGRVAHLQLGLPLELDLPGQGWGTCPPAGIEATFKLLAGRNVHQIAMDSIATYIRFSGPSSLTTEQSTMMRDSGVGNT